MRTYRLSRNSEAGIVGRCCGPTDCQPVLNDELEAESMMLTARSRRAKNRLAEHRLVLVRRGTFNGQPAVLTRCVDGGCGWLGWLTAEEVRLTDS